MTKGLEGGGLIKTPPAPQGLGLMKTCFSNNDI